MSGGHTPGPWEVQREDKRLDSGDVVEWLWVGPVKWQTRVCRVVCYDGEQDEQRANARLIAAAPDLLEALIEALPYVECAEDDPAYKAGAVAKVVKNMRAALAKARQSTPAPDCDGDPS